MSYFLNQFIRSISVFFRTLKAFFARKLMGIGAKLRRLTNFSRSATKAASASLQGVMSAAQKPSERSDYVETGRLFISKALIIRIVLLLVALGLIIYFVVWPFVLSRFLTARFWEEDKRVPEWSGKVIVYSDKKKTLPLFSGRLEDGVLQGEAKLYDREGVLLYEGQLKDGQRTGSGKAYEDGVLVYEGSFAEGLYSGRGRLYEEGQLVYDGQYDGGLRSGSGTVYADGRVLYSGQFLEDVYEGRGKLYEDGALCYDGSFAAGIPEGSGTVYLDGQIVYDGQFSAGLYEGKGKLYGFDAGNSYVAYDGEFHNGKREGQGIGYYASGNPSYQGDWQADAPNGTGTFYGDSDRRVVYEGGVTDGRPDGQGTWYTAEGGQLSTTFRLGTPAGAMERKKNGTLYYQGDWLAEEWAEGTCGGWPEGFGTLYGKGGKVLYQGPFRDGTIDGRSLLGYTTEKLKAALGEGSVRIEREGDSYRIMADELGLTALCTFQTEEADSLVYQIYLAAPEDPSWVALLPGSPFTGEVRLPEGAEPNLTPIIYRAQYGVRVEAGTYTALSGIADAWRTTALFADEERRQAVLLTWARMDIIPKGLELGKDNSGAENVEAFLESLDDMTAPAGAAMGEGAALGDKDPGMALAGCENAAQAVELADAMLDFWAETEEIAALRAAVDRLAVMLEREQEAAAKGVGSPERVEALEQEQLALTGRLESGMTALKRAELRANAAGASDLAEYALGDLVVDFDPSAQEVEELILVAAAYAQAAGSEMTPEEVELRVKLALLDLTDAWGTAKQALGRYQTAGSGTKTAAGDYAMGLGTKESWYAAMNEETLARADLCAALAEFSRQANQFNQLTGGWVSRTFDWQREAFEPLFRAEIREEEPAEEVLPEESGEGEEEIPEEEAVPEGEGASEN